MASFLERYLEGETHLVWDELRALGEGIRAPGIYDDAMAVSRETARRSRVNFERIIECLDGMGYQFEDGPASAEDNQQNVVALGAMIQEALPVARERVREFPLGGNALKAMETLLAGLEGARGGQVDLLQQIQSTPKPRGHLNHLEDFSIYIPARKSALRGITRFEKELGGPMPLLMIAWHEQIESISLVGTHRGINGAPGFSTDAFAMIPLSMEPLRDFRSRPDPSARRAIVERQIRDMEDAIALWRPKFTDMPEILERMEREHACGLAEKEAELARIPHSGQFFLPLGPDKIAKAGKGSDFYYTRLPNGAADFRVEGLPGEVMFLEYLRRTFACGGFPGWYGVTERPAELELLSRDLLPI